MASITRRFITRQFVGALSGQVTGGGGGGGSITLVGSNGAQDAVSNMVSDIVISVPASTNGVLVIFVAQYGASFTSVVFDPAGANLTMTDAGVDAQIFDSGGHLKGYTLVSPASGSKTIRITKSSAVAGTNLNWAVFSNVNQSTPVRNAQTAVYPVGTVTNIATSTITSNAADTIIDCVAGFNAGTYTPQAAQTEIPSISYPTDPIPAYLHMSTKPGSASTTTSWDIPSTANPGIAALSLQS